MFNLEDLISSYISVTKKEENFKTFNAPLSHHYLSTSCLDVFAHSYNSFAIGQDPVKQQVHLLNEAIIKKVFDSSNYEIADTITMSENHPSEDFEFRVVNQIHKGYKYCVVPYKFLAHLTYFKHFKPENHKLDYHLLVYFGKLYGMDVFLVKNDVDMIFFSEDGFICIDSLNWARAASIAGNIHINTLPQINLSVSSNFDKCKGLKININNKAFERKDKLSKLPE
jgi:hypothetical protein